MNKYKISLEKILELLEDKELIKIENIEELVKAYKKEDSFLFTDRVMEMNL